jgi:Protein of unknown function (DUF3300)
MAMSLAVGLPAGWGGALAQTTTTSAQPVPSTEKAAATTFKPEEIEALVAPIALYPDSVLSQVLMASTYPLEIVYAARWLKANPNVKGDAAVKAVGDKPWDVSVKSMVAFPQILEPMNDKLDWTQRLGDAFLAQQKDVLDAVQRLRAKAQENGNLKSTEQQKVTVEPAATGSTQQAIIIEPANPQVVYLPAYDPATVYGYWGYPAYPPYYWPPYPAYYPGYYVGAGIAFGVGLAVAGAIFGNCNWGGGDVNINVNRATNIDRNFDRNKVNGGGANGNGRWQHDASHRQGVAYRDNATRDKFGPGVGGADKRGDFRGFDGGGGRGGVGGAGGAGGADRPGGAGGIGGAGGVGGAGGSVSSRPAGGLDAGRGNAFQGVGGGSATQRDFNRGHSTAQRSAPNRPSGGGGRGGGGRGGGGGRR